MYEHSDYLGHYQGTSAFTDPTETITHELHYEVNTTSFSPNPPHYAQALHALDQQQQFVPIPPDLPYQTAPVPGFPQHWLTTPEPSLIDTQTEQQFRLQPSQQDLAPLTPWPSLPNSNSRSSEDGALGDDLELGDESQQKDRKKERKERRRAQNRVAQRLFRARREVSLKENSQRLETLEDEVGRLQSNNDDLSDTVTHLRNEVLRLKRENVSLKRRLSDDVGEEAEEAEEDESEGDGEVPSIFEQMSPDETAAAAARRRAAKAAKGKEPLNEQHGKGGASYLTRSNRDRRKAAGVNVLEIPSKFL